MCGIFGVITNEKVLDKEQMKSLTRTLLKVSESRGKESAGLTVVTQDKIKVFKLPKPAHILVKEEKFEKLFHEKINTIFGHARLVTNGSLEDNRNNQPVIKDRIVGIHNGIIVNVDNLWKKHKELKRKYEVDTEVLLALFRRYYENTKNLPESIKLSFDEIEGAASIAAAFEDVNVLVLATNTGSLYTAEKNGLIVFASEYNFLLQTIKGIGDIKIKNIKQIEPGSGLIIDLKNIRKTQFSLKIKNKNISFTQANRKIQDLSGYSSFTPPKFEIKITEKIKSEYKSFFKEIRELKRCIKCILPETVPFIEFDDEGICNYCRNFQKIKTSGKIELEKVLNHHRNPKKQDCLVTFSGGRDSSYGLHYIKKILKMNPISYSYDWGMITDLGRRNQARMTGKLGVEQILISADIKAKRDNIKRNVLAWLKRPDLGTVPLFMAGDKQYFYYANKIAKELGIKVIILCINPYEKTDFKFGYCGVRPNAKIFYRIKFFNKIKMALYYLKAFILNPAYINKSLLDTISAFFSYYFIPHEYLSFYEYIDWDEKTIERTLLKDYNWEISPDTKSTWRIGDGTASFYNYIYYVLGGFTENDTFRSNQIRQGVVSRNEAIKLSEEENQPRWESIQWYCDTIGIDSKKTLEIINRAKKRY